MLSNDVTEKLPRSWFCTGTEIITIFKQEKDRDAIIITIPMKEKGEEWKEEIE